MQNKQSDKAGSEKKRGFPRWLIYVLGLLGCFMSAAEGLLLTNSGFKIIGNILLIPSAIGVYVFPVLITVYIIKAIVRGTRKKLLGKREAPEEVTYDEINYSGDADESRTERTFKRFSYNKNDILHLNPDAPPLMWWAVVLFLILLFPFGLFVMIRKIIHEKTRYFDNGVNLIITGGFFTAFTLPWVILFGFTGADDMKSWVILTTLLALPALFGLILIITGIFLRRKGKKYETYMRLIVNERITKIRVIAAKMKTTYAKACETIQKLIDAGLLEGAYIYHRDKEIIVPGVSKKIAFRCKNCGGTTVLYANEKQECVYCGAVV